MGHWTDHPFHMCPSHCMLHRPAQTDGALLTIHTIPAHLNIFTHVNVHWLTSNVIIMLDIYIRSTVSLWHPLKKKVIKCIIGDLFWVLLQLKSVGYFLLWNTFWEVVLWSSLCFVHSNIPEGTVCVLRVGVFFFFFPVKLHILTTAHSDSTVSEEFLSILLCACRELFPLSFQSKSRVGKDLHIDAHSWLLAHPLVCFCREPDRLIQRLLVLNNDMQLLRMSMSFPVFVRSYLVLLWKPNVILNPPQPRFFPWLLSL